MFSQIVTIFLIATVVGVRAGAAQTRMLKADTISIDQAPYIVSLRHSELGGQPKCGGTLITPRFVVTAAHCFSTNDTKDSYIVVGNATTLSEQGVRRRIEAFVKHPQFNPVTFHKDIAVVKLASDMIAKFAIPIKLCDRHLVKSDFLQVSGWGLTEANGLMASEHLRTIRIPVMLQAECVRRHAQLLVGEITDAMVCAIGPNGEDACSLDSGGPAIFKDKLCATVSWGLGCGNSEKYAGVYVRIDKVRDFIEESMRKL